LPFLQERIDAFGSLDRKGDRPGAQLSRVLGLLPFFVLLQILLWLPAFPWHFVDFKHFGIRQLLHPLSLLRELLLCRSVVLLAQNAVVELSVLLPNLFDHGLVVQELHQPSQELLGVRPNGFGVPRLDMLLYDFPIFAVNGKSLEEEFVLGVRPFPRIEVMWALDGHLFEVFQILLGCTR